MSRLNLKFPAVFAPLTAPARYKGAHGGRGSGKSHFFASLMVLKAAAGKGFRAVCIREVQKTLQESSKRLIEDKLRAYGLSEGHGFRILSEHIETPGGGTILFRGMQDANADNIKSLEGMDVAWTEEAQNLSARSLELLRPTLRAPGSELWFSWNPRRKSDAVDVLLRGPELPTGAVVVQANYTDNPFFPPELKQELADCLRISPDQFAHIWEGAYATLLTGAYYARSLTVARQEGRIGRVARDPLLPVFAFADLGGTGAKADAFVLWFVQFVGKEVRVIDYYEAQGQPLETHLAWIDARPGLKRQSIRMVLPHDGATNDRIFDVSFESALTKAGFAVEIVRNQGRGAAMARIEAGRRVFSSCWFDEEKTAPGLEALGYYHEKKDENRQVGLGPEHDWASHCGDAFGLMAIFREEYEQRQSFSAALDYSTIDRMRSA